MHKTQFTYNGYNSPGVFSFLVNKSIDFSLSSVDRYKETNVYCNKSVSSENVSCLVDGRNDTAWRNQLIINSYFIIDFEINHFLLKDYVLKKVCQELPQWKIEGSNDMINWHHVVTHGPMSESLNVSHYHLNQPSLPYHHYKFSLVNPSFIHLSQIEFYGILNVILKITCQHRIHLSIFPLITAIFLSK